MKSNSNFYTALRQEEAFYNNYLKPYLKNKNIDSIFIRYSLEEKSIVYKFFQKENDIDCILDDKQKNFTVSLKVVSHNYNQIFFETISNTTKNTKGWGLYSKADYIVYAMKDKEHYRCIKFKKDDILEKLDLTKYKVRYGETRDNNGKLLYKTEGVLIPLSDFKHKETILK